MIVITGKKGEPPHFFPQHGSSVPKGQPGERYQKLSGVVWVMRVRRSEPRGVNAP